MIKKFMTKPVRTMSPHDCDLYPLACSLCGYLFLAHVRALAIAICLSSRRHREHGFLTNVSINLKLGWCVL